MSTTRIGDFRQLEGDPLFSVLEPQATIISFPTVTPTVSTTPTVTTTAARSAYDLIVDDLNNLYTTLLKRSADKPGLDWWASQVSAGNASIADVANEFRNSAEYKVVTAYNDVLGRYPEEAGLNWWVDQASKQNLTVDQLKKELSKTPELISKQLAPLQSQWDAEVANQEQPGVQADIKSGQITFGGDRWDAYRLPDGGLIIQKMSADQSSLGKNQYRADILNPDTGEVTTQVVNRSQMPTIGRNITLGLMALAALNPGLFDIAGTAAGSTSTGATTAGTTAATGGTTTGGLLSGASDLAVAGVEGAASQAATSAYTQTLAATGNSALANIAADVASSSVAAGSTVAEAVATGTSVASSTAATGAVTGTGNIVGGGGTITSAGIEGAASQAATAAYTQTLAATGNQQLANIAADVASGNVAAGLSVSDAVSAGVTTASSAAATGATTGTGAIVGGGGTITGGISGLSTGVTAGGLLTGAGTAETGATTAGTTTAGTTTGATTAGAAGAGGAAAGTAGATAAGTAAGSTAVDTTKLLTGFGDSLVKGFKDVASTLLGGLAGGNQSNAVAGLISAGIGYQQAKEAADALLQQGQISQQQYNTLASNIQGQYNNLATQTGQQLGEFTPYGITTNLFGPSGQNIQNAAMQAAQQSFNQAGMTNVDQLSQDYYNKLAALSAPEQQRQRLATEERLRAQGRLGVSGSAYGGTSPELLAQEQAIAQQQLQRELQSRQAALGERGTLLSQGTAALQPAVQLGTTAQQAAQQQFASNLARQNLLTNLQTQGIQSAGVLQRQGLQDALSRQLAATAARSGANQQLTQSLFGGATGSTSSGGNSLFGSLLSSMFAPSDTVPGLNMTYAEALSKGLIAP